MLDLSRTLRLIRRRWATIFVVASMTLIASAIYTHLTPKMYGSRVQFWVSTTDNDQLIAGSAYVSRQIVSYTELLKTPMMRQSVVEEAGVDISAGQLAGATTVSNPPASVVLTVNVQQPSSEDALRLAEAYAEVFPATVDEIDRIANRPSPVKVTVVGNPVRAGAPSSPKPVSNLVFALALGLVLGLLGAEARQMFDSKVRTKDDVEEITGRPLLGSVPFDGDAHSHPLAIDELRQSKRAEAYRSLRTNLQFVDVADHPKVIVVTSSLPHEGKSTTVANLALALVRGGRRVCLVEADLRRPKLLEYLGLSGNVGLTDVLIGNRELGEVVQAYGDAGLAVVGSGPLPPNPSELLGSKATIRVLRELADLFDYVLLDGAPLLPVTDSAVLARHADGALLIARHGLVTRDQLAVAVESLRRANANLLGVILNRIPKSSLVANAYGSAYYESSSRGRDSVQPATKSSPSAAPIPSSDNSSASHEPKVVTPDASSQEHPAESDTTPLNGAEQATAQHDDPSGANGKERHLLTTDAVTQQEDPILGVSDEPSDDLDTESVDPLEVIRALEDQDLGTSRYRTGSPNAL